MSYINLQPVDHYRYLGRDNDRLVVDLCSSSIFMRTRLKDFRFKFDSNLVFGQLDCNRILRGAGGGWSTGLSCCSKTKFEFETLPYIKCWKYKLETKLNKSNELKNKISRFFYFIFLHGIPERSPYFKSCFKINLLWKSMLFRLVVMLLIIMDYNKGMPSKSPKLRAIFVWQLILDNSSKYIVH